MTSHFLVLGKNGQLGRCVTRVLAERSGCELWAEFGHGDLDITDRDAVMALQPPANRGDALWVVNAAAYTAVDLCESEEAACTAANGDAPGYLAQWCNEHGAGLVHVSTDYVFAGDASSPYREDDATAPKTAYGRSKLAGEIGVAERLPNAWIARTSWVFGPGKNFVGAIVRQGALRKYGNAAGPLRVVDDQMGCPTYAADLAGAIVDLTQCKAEEQGGVVHLSNGDPCSWWDFARAILDGTGYGDLEIDRVKTSEFVTPAPRPAYSVLDGAKAAGLGVRMRGWREALAAYLASEDFETLHNALRLEAEATS